MAPNSSFARALVVALAFTAATPAYAQTAPQVVWEAPTPSLLANSLQGVAWSPGAGTRVAVGSTDRWVRSRVAGSGALVWSALQPHRSGSADQTAYSTDGAMIAVHNSDRGGALRVHRAADGVFLGTLVITIQPNDIVTFAPDAQLVASTGDAGIARWRISDFRIVRVVGSGYSKIATTFAISPDATLQASATQGTISVRRRSDGATVRLLTGGAPRSSSPMAFSPDNTRLAVWAASPNETTLFRISDGAIVMRLPNVASNEGVVAVRFSPAGTRLVTTGYRPFIAADGTWGQRGVVRFWRVSDGAMRHDFEARTGIGVTSPVAWSPDFARFAYGTYEGSVVVAVVPAP